jgi:hypothetical protein
VPDNVLYTNLNLRLDRVNGAIVRLNGREIFRANLPSGPVTFLTQASIAMLGDLMHDYFPINVTIAGLPPGTNVLAVEVHEFSSTQPSLSFDLELFGTGEFATRLAASLDSNVLGLSWPSNFAGFNLETCTGLPPAGPWQTVAGPYPLSNGSFGLSFPRITGPQQFFRLCKPCRNLRAPP